MLRFAREKPVPVAEVGRMFDREPPHDGPSEMALLGSLILDAKSVLADVLEVLSGPEDFYEPRHGAIYTAIVAAVDAGDPLDLVSLNRRLTDSGTIESVGGVQYLVELAESVPSATSAVHYAGAVRDKARVRKLIEASGGILYRCYQAGEDLEQLLDDAESAVFAIANQKESTADETRLADLLQQAYDRATSGTEEQGLKTGLYDLDARTLGFHPGELIIAAGRPGMGKSTLALDILLNCARQKVPAALFSLEMSKEQLGQRLLSIAANVPLVLIRSHAMTQAQMSRCVEAVTMLADAPLEIAHCPGATVTQVRAKARRLQQRKGIKLLAVDYLQLMRAGARHDNREQEVAEMSRMLKALAGELMIPVLALCQLNRQPEGRADKKPLLSDLRESGAIEMDADVVLLLYREDYYKGDDPAWLPNHEAQVIIAKHRMGPPGVVKLFWKSDTASFENLSHQPEPGGVPAF